jgi:GDP-L-fucose synthase
MIYTEDKILVLGKNSTIGKELQKLLPNCNYVGSADYDLTKEDQVEAMYKKYRPFQVIFLSSVVGSLFFNLKEPAYIMEANMKMNNLVLSYAKKYNVQHVLSILSTCVYSPVQHHASYPLSERLILDGPVEETNGAYALSKRFIAQYTNIINKQYGYNWSYLIPCNLYSIHDKFDLEKSHFVNALVLKIYHEVYYDNKGYIDFRGTGSALRQFISSSDVARVIDGYIRNDYRANLNVVSTEMSIKEMATIALETLGLTDSIELRFDGDTTKDGIYKKTASDQLFRQYFSEFEFKDFKQGIRELWEELQSRNSF